MRYPSDFLFRRDKRNDVELSRNLPGMFHFHNFTVILLYLLKFQ